PRVGCPGRGRIRFARPSWRTDVTRVGEPMSVRYDLAVVGLGIVGASAVYAATRAGARVLALDAGVPGAGTSGTSFAWLNSCRKEPENYYRLNVDGMLAHEELSRDLGGDCGHHPGGSLEWANPGDG